ATWSMTTADRTTSLWPGQNPGSADHTQVGARDLAVAGAAVAPTDRAQAGDIVLGIDELAVAVGHDAADPHHFIDRRGNAFERLLKSRIGHAGDIADANQLRLQLRELDQSRLDQTFGSAGVDGDFVRGIPDFFLAHDFSF